MNYDECVSQLKTMLTVQLNDEDSNFTRILPAMFAYADQRIYGDIDFPSTSITQPMRLLTGTREFTLPASVRVLRSINVCTPPGTMITNSSKRNPLERISAEALDFFWPQASFQPSMPQKYALVGSAPLPLPQATAQAQAQTLSNVVRLMPEPDQTYPIELLGVIRPVLLSPSNPETFLSVMYPSFFLCACMVFGSGYQRDFGAQADDPARAMSWEAQYGYLRQGVALEAARMRGEGPGFTSLPPAQIAQQPRSP